VFLSFDYLVIITIIIIIIKTTTTSHAINTAELLILIYNVTVLSVLSLACFKRANCCSS